MPLAPPLMVVTLAADVDSTTTVFADITGLTVPVAASNNYLVEADLLYQSSAAATGIAFAVNGPASPVAVVGEWRAYTAAGTALNRRFTAYDTGPATTAVATANATEYAYLRCLLRNGTTAGNLTLRFASETGTAVTVKAGSVLRWQNLNPPITAGITTIDRFFGVVQLAQNLSTMQNNMRRNVVIIQEGVAAGTIPTFAAAQQATRDLGTAFLQRLAMNKAVADTYPQDVIAGAQALGILPADMQGVYDLLFTWATNLSTAVITNQTQLDAGVAAVLANVPVAMLAF